MTRFTPWTAAQTAAGVIAARHRGDHADAEALLASFPDEAARTRGFWLLAELSLSLVREATGQSTDELVRELTIHLGQADELLPPPPA